LLVLFSQGSAGTDIEQGGKLKRRLMVSCLRLFVPKNYWNL